MSANTLLEILQTEHRCELTGLPHGARPHPEFHVPHDKLFQLKDSFFRDVDLDDEFMLVYIEILRLSRMELERLDTMTDEFCSSYLEALKPGPATPSWDPQKPLLKRKEEGVHQPFSPDGYSSNKKRRGNLPKAATNVLKKWLFDHLFHPYPTEEEKQGLSLQTGLSLNQISNWYPEGVKVSLNRFINARRRILQPMLESVRQQQGGNMEGHAMGQPIPSLSSYPQGMPGEGQGSPLMQSLHHSPKKE